MKKTIYNWSFFIFIVFLIFILTEIVIYIVFWKVAIPFNKPNIMVIEFFEPVFHQVL